MSKYDSDIQKDTLKILAPKFSKNLDPIQLINLIFEDESCYSHFILSDCNLEPTQGHLLNFEGVIFKNVDFRSLHWSSLSLSNVRFENCDLSNVDFSGAIIHKTEFIDCKLMGLNLREATLQNVRMTQCKAPFIFLRFSRLKQTIFESCQFENGDFQNATLSKVVFKNCVLRLCQMSGTRLMDIDLSDSDVEGLGVRMEDLAGAIVSPSQAVDFSKLFGLVVKF